MEAEVKNILKALGEDPSREGLKKTPERVKAALTFLTQGYLQNPYELIQSATFSETTNSMIVIKDIELYSLCEHHLLPFFGKCHVGYIPNGHVVGLSKIPRLVEIYARRLQMQERLTEQIAHTLHEVLKPKGVGVIVEASHLCLQMRGIQKQNSKMVTSSMLGNFRENLATREEFMSFVRA